MGSLISISSPCYTLAIVLVYTALLLSLKFHNPPYDSLARLVQMLLVCFISIEWPGRYLIIAHGKLTCN